MTFCWLINFIILCRRKYQAYLVCRRTPNLHPIYSDIEFLSQQRKLYNLKTHIVKYILIIICSCVELFNLLWFIVDYLVQLEQLPLQRNDTYVLEFEKVFPNCSYKHLEVYFLFRSGYIPLYNVNFLCFLMTFALLSILTRYLAARYLNHSFKPILIKYIVWSCVQLASVIICSTLYTLVLTVLFFPVLVSISWIVLIRDSFILSRVLKSNLRELQLHGYSKHLYKEQLYAYKFYLMFRRVLFVSTFCLALSISVRYSVENVLLLYTHRFCLFSFVYNLHIPTSIQHSIRLYRTLNNSIIRPISAILFGIYTLGMTVPLWFATLFPIVSKCIKRWREKEGDYVFNYENLNLIKR